MSSSPITSVVVRMYCMGTGDCFVLKFFAGDEVRFKMLVDCGSCVGTAATIDPYVADLANYVDFDIDLLVVTHEHNDHVSGFRKSQKIFGGITVRQAWFAWTENPSDPNGRAADLQRKRQRMRLGFQNALTRVKANRKQLQKKLDGATHGSALPALNAFINGLHNLGGINLAPRSVPAAPNTGAALPGMIAIKELLAARNVPTRYLLPGTTLGFAQPLPGVRFHVLGPPLDKKYIYKEGRQGRDVYRNNFALGEGLLAMNAFANLDDATAPLDLPFGREYVVDPTKPAAAAPLIAAYQAPAADWRTIENEWLYAAGSLAIRLDSHINNTSLVLAIEIGEGGPVLLLPGDAEFGSWESWHQIEEWAATTRAGKPFVEDLLNRTVFYKVSHHLSYNGTAVEQGLRMMTSPALTAMATLDRTRISSGWKSTMPNHTLLSELIRRCQGKCFLMDDAEIDGSPTAFLDPTTLPDYEVGTTPEGGARYKQYRVRF
jgi:hypothetical protein